jgi:hypothetical protein
MNIPGVFQPFVHDVRAAFDYLVTTYAFQRTTEKALGPEAWVVFESETTRITVHYEMGSAPWVEIGRLENLNGRRVQTKEIGLDVLLREKGNVLIGDIEPPRDLIGSELSAMLQARARLLAEAGDDLLRGNFESFPRLWSKAEKELRKREAELYRSTK